MDENRPTIRYADTAEKLTQTRYWAQGTDLAVVRDLLAGFAEDGVTDSGVTITDVVRAIDREVSLRRMLDRDATPPAPSFRIADEDGGTLSAGRARIDPRDVAHRCDRCRAGFGAQCRADCSRWAAPTG